MNTFVLGMQDDNDDDKNNNTKDEANTFQNSFDVYINSRKINPASIPLPSTFRTSTQTTSTVTNTQSPNDVTTTSTENNDYNECNNDHTFTRYNTCDCKHTPFMKLDQDESNECSIERNR